MPLADTLNRKPGDILKSDDWNVIIKEIDRLETAKINRDGADTLKGPLTIAGALNADSNVTVKGNIGIATTAPPTERLEVNGNVKATSFFGDGSNLTGVVKNLDLAVKKAGDTMTGSLTIQNSLTVTGNIGIATTAPPTERLEVNGNVKATSFLGDGSNLTGVVKNLDLAVKKAGDTMTGSLTIQNSLTVTGNLSITFDSYFGCLPDQFTYDNKSMGHYSLGWFRDSWQNGGPTAWLSSFGGIKFFTTGQPRLMIDAGGKVGVTGNLSVTNVLEIGDTPFTGNTGGNRDWMQKGIKINWDTDSLFIGLKNEGTDRKDAVIAWGDNLEDDLRFINVIAGGDPQGTELMRIKPSGNVGIGTDTPNKGKLHIEGSVNYQDPSGYRYFVNRSDNGNTHSGTGPYSLYASLRIGCPEVNVFSDVRIKEIKGNSNSQADLQALLQIQVTDYYYKDKIAKGNRPKKKVIGQQIATVYPQAVSTHVDTVPDIFESAIIEENWVTLNNHNLKIGDKVKIFWNDDDSQLFTVEAIKTDKFKISLNHTGDIFVYGREVDDFHVVDYDALSMLHISATQELYKIIKKLEGKINEKINA